MPSLLLALMTLLSPARAERDLMAEGMLKKSRPRMAAQRFREVLEKRPGDADVELGLARSWAALGWCDRAIPELERLRSTDAWTAEGALALGDCYADWWRRDEALDVLQEALVMTDDGPGVQTRLAWEALLAGDRPLFDSVLETFLDEDPTSKGSLLLLGAQAWDEGEFTAMAVWLEQLRAEQPRAPKADLLDAWAWLELGQPGDATLALRGQSRLERRRLPDVAAWMMESNRRQGDWRVVRNMLDQRTQETTFPPARQALRLRARADLDGASTVRAETAALLAAHPFEPEALATAWYVATLAGDAAGADALAERYRVLVPAGRRPLHALLPLVPTDALPE